MTRAPRYLGIDGTTGVYDPGARPPKFVSYTHHYGGRARIRVEEGPMPLHLAKGLRDALSTMLTQLDAEIAQAGGGED